MELRHLRYFIAVAEEGSFTQAAEKRLHTAQPSLSRQIRDLETSLGVKLILRGPRGMELTPPGKVFLEHARLVLAQIDTATEATRRAARPAKTSFIVGFLAGQEMEWLPEVLEILRDKLEKTEVTIHSSSSPQLTEALQHGRIDVAFLRPGKPEGGLEFKHVTKESLYVLLPADHRLASHESVTLDDIADDTFINFSNSYAPALRLVIDGYLARSRVVLRTGREAEGLALVISLVLSTPGVSLLPAYTRKLLPASVIGRPLQGETPTIDLAIGYNTLNISPLLKFFLGKADDLIARTAKLRR